MTYLITISCQFTIWLFFKEISRKESLRENTAAKPRTLFSSHLVKKYRIQHKYWLCMCPLYYFGSNVVVCYSYQTPLLENWSAKEKKSYRRLLLTWPISEKNSQQIAKWWQWADKLTNSILLIWCIDCKCN